MWQLLPPTTLLLLLFLAAAGSQPEELEDRPKAVVSLSPEWDSLLEKDSVTLKCQGAPEEENSSTLWWHDRKPLPNSASSYVITSATVDDSGEYRCQVANLSAVSDPVQLQVHAAWLLLQAQRWVVQEGESLVLRCHSWKNVNVIKVQYYQNGRPKKFFPQNSNFHIPKVTGSHSGSYYCRGMIGTRNMSSEAVTITVQALEIPPTSPRLPVLFCLVLGLLFVVDTGLYFSVWRDLQSALRNRRNEEVTRNKIPQDELEP